MTRHDLLSFDHAPQAVPRGGSLSIAIIGCGKSKRDYPCPARDLYTGPLFTDARQFVSQDGRYTAWYILSARHGIIHPDRIVGPYDATLAGLTLDALRSWQNKVDSQFRFQLGYGDWSANGGHLEIDVFAGAAYLEALPPQWSELSWEINAPHAGLGIGERRKAFRTDSEEVAS